MGKGLSHTGFFLAYVAQILNIGVGILLLPFILHYLNSTDIGLWFVFITLASFAQLFELGFQPTLARNIAYIYSGAVSLEKQGLPLSLLKNEINLELLSNFLFISRKIYRILAFFACLFLVTLGSIYVYSVLDISQNIINCLVAWIIFSLGYVITFYIGFFNGVLQGRGDIVKSYQVVIINKGSFIILGIFFIVMGYGLIGLGFASFISALLGGIAAQYFFFSDRNLAKTIKIKSKNYHTLTRILWYNSTRTGIVNLGAFLIQKSNILITSSFLSLEIAANYGMTITIFMALAGVASVVSQAQIPYITTLQIQNKRKALIATYGEIIIIASLLYTIFFAVIFFYGSDFLITIKSSVTLLSPLLLFFLGVIIFFEMNHSIAAAYLTTVNEVPFIPAALISGLIIIVSSLLTVNRWGLLGIIATQGIVQLFYNNWKWPLEVLKLLDSNINVVLKEGIKKIEKRFSI